MSIKQNELDMYKEIAITLLMNKYRYYVLNTPTITDWEYDMMERNFFKLGVELGKHELSDGGDCPNWIGFDLNHEFAEEALAKLGLTKEEAGTAI